MNRSTMDEKQRLESIIKEADRELKSLAEVRTIVMKLAAEVQARRDVAMADLARTMADLEHPERIRITHEHPTGS